MSPADSKPQSEYEKSLQEMYELGKKHGYSLALKELEIIRLQKEIEDIK